MFHMKERWKPVYDADTVRWYVGAAESGFWICMVYRHLPGDITGGLTARAICDAHNAGIKAKRKSRKPGKGE